MRPMLMVAILTMSIPGLSLAADCPHVEVRDTGRVHTANGSRERQFEVKNLGPGSVGFLVWRTGTVPTVYGHSADIEVEVGGRWQPYTVMLGEYMPADYTMWLKPGQSQPFAVGEPRWGSGADDARGNVDTGPFTLRLSDHRFKCFYRSEHFVPAEMRG